MALRIAIVVSSFPVGVIAEVFDSLSFDLFFILFVFFFLLYIFFFYNFRLYYSLLFFIFFSLFMLYKDKEDNKNKDNLDKNLLILKYNIIFKFLVIKIN